MQPPVYSCTNAQRCRNCDSFALRTTACQDTYRRVFMLIDTGRFESCFEKQTLALTAEYTQQRKAFGGTLFDMQHTRFKLAEVASIAHVVRSFINDCTQRRLDSTLDGEAAYMAKWWCTEQQCRVTDECLQLFGGYGYMAEYPIARMYAASRVQKIYGGTNEVMKDLIARKL